MKTASQNLIDTVNNSVSVQAVPFVLAEWNQNRYAGIKSISSNVFDDEIEAFFPVSSVVKPLRPDNSVVKLLSTDTISFEDYNDVPNKRYYMNNIDDNYQYWVSPNKTESDGGFLQPVSINIEYDKPIYCNKVVLCFQTNELVPTVWDIQYSYDGISWSHIAENIVPDSKGRVVLYQQVGGTWNQTPYYDNQTYLKYLKLTVRAGTPLKRAAVVEVSPRLQKDLSDRVIDYSSNFTMSDQSFLAPLGRASSNSGSLTLANEDGYFLDDSGSVLNGLADKNVLFKVYLKYTVADLTENIKQLTMYSDQWSDSAGDNISVSLLDGSKFLSEIKPEPYYLQNTTIAEIVSSVMDLNGFTNYSYSYSGNAGNISFFWFTGEETIWEKLSSFGEATQTAIYFDEYNVLQIKQRDQAFSSHDPDMTLNYNQMGQQLPNIISLNKTVDYESNSVRVKYTDTKLEEDSLGNPIMQVIWQQNEDLVLRSSRIQNNVQYNDNYLTIPSTEAAYWPFEGKLQLDSEIISYSGKGYNYYDKNDSNNIKHVYVKTNEEKIDIDKNKTAAEYKSKNQFSGYLSVANRGLYGSYASNHSANHKITGTAEKGTGTARVSRAFTYNKNAGIVNLTSLSTAGSSGRNHAYYALDNDQEYTNYGTRIRFAKTGKAIAGLFINGTSSYGGYYVELVASETLTTADRKVRNEINGYKVDNSGNFIRYGIGSQLAIARGVWYDMDVEIIKGTSTVPDAITVYINGQKVYSFSVPVVQRLPMSLRFGMFIRDYSSADFEYFYANTGTELEQSDTSTYYDRIYGGYRSSKLNRATYKLSPKSVLWGKKRVLIINSSEDVFFMDEFGCIAHEVKDFDVKFEQVPVQYSRLYYSNDSQIDCWQYNSTPFKSSFILTNSSRQNAIAAGEDTLMFGSDNPVTQKLMVYGRVIRVSDQKEVVVKNEQGIQARGLVEVEIDNPFIQNKSAADEISNWIIGHWSDGQEELEVEIFGNPFLQLGDVVSVDYPLRSITYQNNKYFVFSISNSFDTGLNTTLTLRRV